MKHFLILSTIAAFGLAACDTAPTPSADAPEWLSIVDKTLVSGDTTVVLGSDGTISGSGIEGVWEERDGKYCRTLTKPERFAGTECQVATVDGDQITFDNLQGRTSTWTIQ